MSRLIDADAFDTELLQKGFADSFVKAFTKSRKKTTCTIGEMRDMLAKQPTVDAVPVVRCKDCKWWKTDWYKGVHGECPNVFAEPDWFCADGERKDG